MPSRYAGFLDEVADAQFPERSPGVVHAAIEDLLDGTETFRVQAQLRVYWTKKHEGIAKKFLLLRRH